jgi:hypothetical protein
MDHAARDLMEEYPDIILAFGESDEFRLVLIFLLVRVFLVGDSETISDIDPNRNFAMAAHTTLDLRIPFSNGFHLFI